MKKIFAVLLLASAATSYAYDLQVNTAVQAALETARLNGIDWKVGDHSEYSVKLSGMNFGTMTQTVTKDEGAAFWMKQEMKLPASWWLPCWMRTCLTSRIVRIVLV